LARGNDGMPTEKANGKGGKGLDGKGEGE
jgi:hypothetical protein